MPGPAACTYVCMLRALNPPPPTTHNAASRTWCKRSERRRSTPCRRRCWRCSASRYVRGGCGCHGAAAAAAIAPGPSAVPEILTVAAAHAAPGRGTNRSCQGVLVRPAAPSVSPSSPGLGASLEAAGGDGGAASRAHAARVGSCGAHRNAAAACLCLACHTCRHSPCVYAVQQSKSYAAHRLRIIISHRRTIAQQNSLCACAPNDYWVLHV